MNREKINFPIISLIIPAYNVESYIEKCVKSAIDQTLVDVEVLVVDDGSTDASPSIVKRLARNDDRITLIRQDNSGVSAARNQGIRHARGKYIAFVDGDDWISEDFAQYMVSIIEEAGTIMALSVNNFTTRDHVQVSEDDDIELWTPSEATARLLYPGIPIGAWNKIYLRSFLLKQRLFFQEDMFMGEGMRFITDVAQRSNGIAVGQRKVYWYRLNNSSSATTAPSIKHGEAALDAIRSIRDNLLLSDEEVLNAVNFHEWMNNFYMIRILEANNSSAFACKKYIRAIRSDPFGVFMKSSASFSMKVKMLCIVIFPKAFAKMVNLQKRRSLLKDMSNLDGANYE